MRKGLLVFASLCAGFAVFPQAIRAQEDSIALDPVTVRSPVPYRYMAGLFVQTTDSLTLREFRFATAENLLSYTTPLAFRNYGNGQLSTVAFRGTSSNHTAVIWNGVNINLPALGQSDFSTLPVAAFDRLSVQYGAGGSSIGSDAVGGSILLESVQDVQTGSRLGAGMQAGSFDNYQVQVLARYGVKGSGKWGFSGKSLIYRDIWNNHYPYTQVRGRPVGLSETFRKGMVQDLFLAGPAGQQLSAHLWFSDNDLVLVPGSPVAREKTLTRSARMLVRYSFRSWSVRASWLKDILDYGKGDFSAMDHSATDRYGMKAEREFSWPIGQTRLYLMAGGEFTHYRAKVDGYRDPLVTENRGDLFMLTRWIPMQRAQVSFNLRQAFVSGYTSPFTPSAGLDYTLLKRDSYLLKFHGSLARSYRVPTLNERYWKDLGNPDIRPEDSFNKEIGLSQQLGAGSRHKFQHRFQLYHNRVDNWVYWNPAKNFFAENLQLVVARGIELHNSWEYGTRRWKYGLQDVIGYTRSTQERSYDAYAADLLGKQLRFVPVWKASWITWAQYGKTRLTAQFYYESIRYINNFQYLPSYALLNVVLDHHFRWGKGMWRIQGRVINATDSFYLDVKSNAMPGRSYAVHLVFDIGPLSRDN